MLSMCRELDKHVHVCVCVFVSRLCFLGVCRTGDISWLIDKGSQWLHIWRSDPKSTGHIYMDTYGAETLSSYTGLDTHLNTHTHIGDRTVSVGDTFPWGRHWNLLLFLRDTLTWQTETYAVWIAVSARL